jgi:hypothetical protein
VLPGASSAIEGVACEDLILYKLVAGRLLDRADVGALLRANVETLDEAYLAEWSRQLEVADDLAAIWREAPPQRQLRL